MRLRQLLALLLALPTALACSATRAKPAAPKPEPAARFTLHAALASVPAGAGEVRVGVRVPERSASGELAPLSAYGVVGNAPFELALPASEAGTLEQGPVRLTWQHLPGSQREVVVATRGKPLELALRVALTAPAGAAIDADKVQAELVAAAFAEVDARSTPLASARCERIK